MTAPRTQRHRGGAPPRYVRARPCKRLAYSIHEVTEVPNEPTDLIAKHCRTQALRGAYKTGGKTSQWRIPPKAIDYYQATRPDR
jgi:hypothetical protein